MDPSPALPPIRLRAVHAVAVAGVLSLLFVAFLIFLVVGDPASGLASAPELLPTPWKEIGGFLPPGALGDALRGTAYFDGAAIGGSVLVLLAWVAIGVGLHLLVDRRQRPIVAIPDAS